MKTVSAPGVYDWIPADDYHGKLTPGPSMSASMAVDLMDECPRKLWHNSYLNPAHEPEHDTKFDLGTAGHLAVLEPDEWNARVVVINEDTYQTKIARAARDEAWATGRTPLLAKHVDQIIGLRDAILADPIAGPAFKGTPSEQTVVCRDPETGIWMKCRPDKRAPDWSWVADIKTTTSANPREIGKRAEELGWFQRAEWYLSVIEGATGIRPADFFFIVAENKPPHIITTCRFPPVPGGKPLALEWGAMMNRKAIDVFAECVARNHWPAYAKRVVDLKLPPWAELRLQDRCDAGEFATKPLPAELRRAVEFQAPHTVGGH